MKFIKSPKAKRNDKVIPFEQDLFTALYEDLPASEIPKGGVVKSENILLMGQNTKVRFGSREWSSTTFPTLHTSTATSTGSVITLAEALFPSQAPTADTSENGSMIYWNDGTISQIVNVTSTTQATINDSTGRTSQAVTIRGQINGLYWHKKSQKMFLHIDERLFYASYDVASWTEITESSGNSLSNSKSTFDSFQDFVYIFNKNGVYKLESNITPLELFRINTTVPDNTINTELVGSTWDYPTKNVESRINRYGRNYLFSLLRLAGTGSRDRTTQRIKKETPTNAIRESDDFIDYKKAFFPHAITGILGKEGSFGTDDYASTTYVEFLLSNRAATAKELKDWFVVQDKAFNLDTHRRIEITTLTSSGTTATATTNEEHGLTSSIAYTIAGATQGDYNGSFTITVTSSTTFTYTMDDDPVADTATGNFIYVKLSLSRELVFDFTQAEKSWQGIADSITDAMRDTFPEYLYCYCYYDNVEASLNFISGENDVHFTGLAAPGDDFDQLGLQYINTEADTAQKIGAWQVLGDTPNNVSEPTDYALQVPSGQYGWTHYSVYSTQTFGPDSIVSGNETTDKEQFIWNRDIPVINVVEGAVVSHVLTASIGTFRKEDVGCRIQSEELDITHIVAYKSSTVVFVEVETIATMGWIIGGKGDTIMTATQDEGDGDGADAGTTVTKQNGSEVFAAADVGKTIYWADGTYSIIKSVTSSTVAVVADSDAKTETPMSFEPTGRDFADVTKDEILSYRIKDFSLYNRFWTALPSGQLGTMTPGFLIVAARLGIKAYYSQFSTAYNYYAGHYYSAFQYVELKDRLICIEEMPTQVIFWASTSTWKAQTNLISTVEEPRLGESIALLAGFDVLDENIGATDKGGIVNCGTGKKIVITSEPGIRIFDGYRYSENMILDEYGNGYIKETLQQLRNRFTSIYESNLYGFLFWGNTSSDTVTGDADIGKTDTCYRRAIQKEQGQNFSSFTGDDWVWPYLGGGALEITDGNEHNFIIVFDYKSTKPYILSTRKLPSIASQDIAYLDKEDDQDTEIASSLLLPERTAQDEEDKIRIIQHYLFMRPENESSKDGAGYDSYGFRDAQRLTVKAYVNGNTTNASLTNTVNPKSQLNFPEKIEDRRIQIEINATASELIYTKHKLACTVLDRRQSPANVVQQDTYERNLSYPIFWATRGRFFYYNLYTGSAPSSGTITRGTNSATGPDGLANSAFYPTADTTWTNAQSITGDFTLMFGLKGNGSINEQTIIDLGDNIEIKLYSIPANGASVFKLIYENGTDTLDLAIDYDTYADAWFLATIERTGSTINFYVNGVLAVTDTETSLTTITGDIVCHLANATNYFFDIRLFSSLITTNELLWYYDNVVNKAGYALMPKGEA